MIIKLDKRIDHAKCILFLQDNYMENIKLINSGITFEGRGILNLIFYGRLHPLASIRRGSVDFSKNDQTIFKLDLLHFKMLTIGTFLLFALGFVMIYDQDLGVLAKYVFLILLSFIYMFILWERKRKIIKEIYRIM